MKNLAEYKAMMGFKFLENDIKCEGYFNLISNYALSHGDKIIILNVVINYSVVFVIRMTVVVKPKTIKGLSQGCNMVEDPKHLENQ